jgi:hypothetical protein
MDEIKLSNGAAAPPIHHNIENEGERSRVYLSNTTKCEGHKIKEV